MCGWHCVNALKLEMLPRILFPVRVAGRSHGSRRGRSPPSSRSGAVTDRHRDARGVRLSLLSSALPPGPLQTANLVDQRQAVPHHQELGGTACYEAFPWPNFIVAAK